MWFQTSQVFIRGFELEEFDVRPLSADTDSALTLSISELFC